MSHELSNSGEHIPTLIFGDASEVNRAVATEIAELTSLRSRLGHRQHADRSL
jgi:hypothetical protein